MTDSFHFNGTMLCLWLAACGPAVPRESIPVAETPPAQRAVSPEPQEEWVPPPGPSIAGFGLVFHEEGGEWTGQIVIAPWGDVVAIGRGRARLLARDTGRVLVEAEACSPSSPDAAAFIDQRRMLVGCDDRVEEVFFPEGSKRTRFQFPQRMRQVTINGRWLVAGTDHFWNRDHHRVSIYDVNTFKLVDEFDASGEIEAVAISSDGKRAAAGTDGKGIDVRDVAAKRTQTFLADSGQRHSLVRFSPSARALFCDNASFEGGEIDTRTGKHLSSYKSGSWLKAVRYINETEMLATGSDGLVHYSGRGVSTPSPIGNLGEGLDLSADKSFFCAAGRDGNVTCFSKKKVLPSTFKPFTGSPTP
jgi:hypothetical protein